MYPTYPAGLPSCDATHLTDTSADLPHDAQGLATNAGGTSVSASASASVSASVSAYAIDAGSPPNRIYDPVPPTWLPNWPPLDPYDWPGHDPLPSSPMPWSAATESAVQRWIQPAPSMRPPLPMAGAMNSAPLSAPIAPRRVTGCDTPGALHPPAPRATAAVKRETDPRQQDPSVTLQRLSLHIQRLDDMDQALQRDEPLTPRVAADMLKAAAWLKGWPADLHVQYIDRTVQPAMALVLRVAAGQTPDSPPPNGVSILRDMDGTLMPGPVDSATDLLQRIPGSSPLDYADALLTALRWINQGSFRTAVQALLQNANTPTGQVRRHVDGNGRCTGVYKDLLNKIVLTIQDKGRLTRSYAEQHRQQLLRQPCAPPMNTAAGRPPPP